ncbi:GntR family transcriptional regulator [Streptomyces griseorubiginosus]|uniref:GntR family transcriptional regulator n=1 Tax=Streptomyces griseorubiginosus TaxID=67304 RepID=UPI00331C48FE
MAVRQPTVAKLPRSSPLGSFIYVVHFDGGVIKVGFTARPAQRIQRYRSSLSPFGITIADLWLSAPHKQAEDSEKLLLSFCRAQSGQDDRGEYFSGIDFAQVVAFAGTLAYGTRQAIPGALAQPRGEGQRRDPLQRRQGGEPPFSAKPESGVIEYGPVAPYRQLAEILKVRIARGDWAEGRSIASEMQLVQEYGIARMTVRRALEVLVEERLVWKVPGRGTYVGQPPEVEVPLAQTAPSGGTSVADPPDRVWRQVADWIVHRIEAGELAPGARLEGERELAEQLGVAIGSVRRAIKELRERGVVVTLPAKGTYVAERPDEG